MSEQPSFMKEQNKKQFGPNSRLHQMLGDDGEGDAVEKVDGEPEPLPFPDPAGEPAPPYAATPATAVKYESKRLDRPSFTLMPIEQTDSFNFAAEWRPTMAISDYIGNNALLLDYLFKLERHHKVVMPIKACGIDPIIFSNLKFAGVGDTNRIFYIPNDFTPPAEEQEEPTEMAPAYELIEVDGDLYLSCVTECLDDVHLRDVLSEATTAIRSTGHYTYQMVDYRKLALEEGETEGKLIRTLRLNTFEMSVLETYMRGIPEMVVSYEIINQHQCICFDIAD